MSTATREPSAERSRFVSTERSCRRLASATMDAWCAFARSGDPMHREMGTYGSYLQHDPAVPEYILAVNWAVTDFTRDNGATR